MTTMSPPISPQPHDSRPRPTTMMSFASTRSHRSSSSGNKLDLVESPKDKKKLNTKADPRKALNEAQPAVVAQQESNLEDLRGVQHKDTDGNVITDPDRSNPTRYRLERPLDTIRSFNAAAEGTTYRRSSYQNRSSSYGMDSRRNSQYGNQFAAPSRARPSQGGYYRHSSYGVRPDGYADENIPQPPYGRPRPPQQPYTNGESSGHAYQQSYETVTSGSEDYSKSTNPSSQNSSFDRIHQAHMRKPDDHYNQYDNEAYHPNQPNGFHQRPPPQQQQSQTQQNPQFQAANNPHQPLKLTNSRSEPPPTLADLQKALPNPKRQSWIKRKFSRRDS